MFDEMSFLFEASKLVKNNVNSADAIASTSDPAQVTEFRREYNKDTKDFEINKYSVTTGNVRNYIRSDVNNAYRGKDQKNPYLQVISDFNGETDGNSTPALKLSSTDFAYLRDIGVYPINRLMILRRYAEGVIVPKDLQLLNAEPISTVIGWVKDENDFLNFNFNEVWVSQRKDDMLHLMLNKMIDSSFGINLAQIVPVPGWGIGFVFGILNRLGLTDYNKTNIPIGDPNVLKESVTREVDEFGLSSSFSFNLETVYEQKYIGGIDMTVSTMEILNNLLTMGTSDTNFIGKTDSDFIKNLRAANNDPTSLNAWVYLITEVVDGFIDAIVDEVKELFDDLIAPPNTEEQSKNSDSTKSPAAEQGAFIRKLFDNKILQSILASTVARYVWPLRGSIQE